jgi:hypothetical protein
LPRAASKAYLCATGQGEYLAMSLMNVQPHDGMVLVTTCDAIARADTIVASSWELMAAFASTRRRAARAQ